jgi:mRNA-degrading endonuclease RelE of RelBE toxin-antitoxin system
MAYTIEVSTAARDDVRALSAAEQAEVRQALPRYLAQEPDRPSHKRKPLEPNPLGATWELRLGDLRVLYAIDTTARRVRVLNAGRKTNNRLYIRGVVVEMRLP